jgi:membrane protein involved in colicin uptake
MNAPIEGLRLSTRATAADALASAAETLIAPKAADAPKAEEPAKEEVKLEPAPEPAQEPEARTEPKAEAAPATTNEKATTPPRAEERQRVADVFASDASKGKERAAASLLANPKLSADDIIGLLPNMKGGETNQMLASLAAAPNPDLKPGTDSGGGSGAEATAYWDRVHARTFGTTPNSKH